MSEKVNKKTKEYYEDAQILHNLFWSKKNMHYGFWDQETRKLFDALENTNKFVSQMLDLQKNDYVLDAGCRVGGTCVYMAENFGVKVME